MALRNTPRVVYLTDPIIELLLAMAKVRLTEVTLADENPIIIKDWQDAVTTLEKSRRS